ncbi:FMN-binding domain protein [Metarhizium robertsii]|uniref:FMN-binding split barrel n=2 Tax=Metarhizium robertsii TaxID=568076 RepID=E9F0S8_METRA|nr:FMN-binding split barrel [Metarhizium robertsii ARSEF 23]EFY98738.1 FMN-binding split barrel [Metarhizium robertsii ARSEF 23]EXV04105.1 FMN-binding domain protein [Metarhizium robertsii]
MHLRTVHAESRIPVLRDLIRSYPLGVLTTAIPSSTEPFIQATHIPWVLDVQDESSETELGVLRGHLARQNPHSKVMIESVSSNNNNNATNTNVLEQDVLVLFTATPSHYVTPQFYTETKPSTGKVVPTWNYAAVQAYGKARIYYDSKSDETSHFLTRQITDLTNHTEISIMDYTGQNGRPDQWNVTDAPDRYIELLKKNIIGIEISIDKLQGKFKMSQEMSKGDRDGVVQGFARLESDVARAVSEVVQERSEMREAAKG